MRNCPIFAVLANLGQFPILINILAAMMKLVAKNRSLILLAFNEVGTLSEDNKNHWLNSIKYIQKQIDMEQTYINGKQISGYVLF